MKYSKFGKSITDIQAAILLYSEVEYLYEFCEIFGKKRFLKFIDVFSGQVIRVPSRDELKEYIQQVSIWSRYKLNHNKYELSDIAKDTGYTKKEDISIYEDIDSKFNKMGIAIGEM